MTAQTGPGSPVPRSQHQTMKTRQQPHNPRTGRRLPRRAAHPSCLCRSKLPLRSWLTAIPLLLMFSIAAAHAAATVLFHAEPRMIEILENDRTLLTYPFGTNQFKPYVRELRTLDGVNLLRDAPADHLHHHGLMYGIKVNNVNFWEEPKDAGHQLPQNELTREVKQTPEGRQETRFSQVLHWVDADHVSEPDTTPFALLVEKRTLSITVDPASEQILLEWQSDFTAGQASPQVTLSGASYHGLGIRFPAEFDGVAHRRNSDNLPYPEGGQQGVLPVRWMAVSHVVAGRPYTLTLFNHPANPGRARFFSMLEAFTYLSATQGLDEAPLTYRAGDQWTLKYAILVSPGRPSEERLNRQYESLTRDP